MQGFFCEKLKFFIIFERKEQNFIRFSLNLFNKSVRFKKKLKTLLL